ncbi:hypothetical protein PN836_019915 [Ningiella sp. W23]|uniref:hypothetical protein n=1 Tax=Ningiella sp. W23 TaxID=3023715 RepID=UPI003756594D
MPKMSLPVALRMALKQHVMSSDIQEDDELRGIVDKLEDLQEKVEKVKRKALENRQRR